MTAEQARQASEGIDRLNEQLGRLGRRLGFFNQAMAETSAAFELLRSEMAVALGTMPQLVETEDDGPTAG